jgi:hypothetical protein
MFLKSGSGVTGIIYGSSIEATIQGVIGVGVEGEISVDEEGAPLAVQPFINVILEGEVGVELEVC